MLRVGQQAPDFTLPGAAAGDIDTHGLSEYTSRGWAVVLVFYPFDFHPACTSQWCSLRDADWLTLEENVAVLGVGADAVYAHQEYAAQHTVQFPLLVDTDGRVSEAYGVLTSGASEGSSVERSESDGVLADEFEGHRGVPERATFVIDPDHRIQFAWRAETPSDQPDMDALRTAMTCRGDECAIEGSEEAA